MLSKYLRYLLYIEYEFELYTEKKTSNTFQQLLQNCLKNKATLHELFELVILYFDIQTQTAIRDFSRTYSKKSYRYKL